jgi:hypothetical protein
VTAPGRWSIRRRSSTDQLIDTSRNSTTVALMTKAVQFDSYGGVDVLEVRDGLIVELYTVLTDHAP